MNWRVYLRLGRVSNLPTVWTNCIAGMALAGPLPDLMMLAVVCTALSMFYTGGMFLNDAFDHRFDSKYRPERPIPSGVISAARVYSIGFGLLFLGPVGLALWSVRQNGTLDLELLGWSICLAALIVYYDYRHKSDPMSPVVMALCRFLVYFVAAAAVGSALLPEVVTGAAVLAAYLIGLTYIAKQENLSEVKNLWPLVCLAAPFLYGIRNLQGSMETLVAVALLAGVVAFALKSLVSARQRNIPRAVVTLIAGISLLDAVIVSSNAPGSWSWVCVGGFLATLFFQRFIAGT